MDRLRGSIDLAEDAMTLADALVLDQNKGEAQCNEEAKALISGIILDVVCHDAPEHRNLVSVREYLTLALHAGQRGAGGLIAQAANPFLGKSEREAAGVLFGAQRHTHFLDSPRIAQVVKTSDFGFANLKNHIATVFLVRPPDRPNTYARWLRPILAQAINDMARSPDRPSRISSSSLSRLSAFRRARFANRIRQS
ncbi:MAG: putative TraG conjugal transfer transrane protein [Sphingomonadales bacterium]|nr:putative TraG conjugal transfer transrane protein [Sphingomonadales bacterium]